MHQITSTIGQYMVTILGAFMTLLNPTFPIFFVCTFAVLCDCYTAWALSHRAKKKFPGATDGKFKSSHFGDVIKTLIKVYALIVLAFLIDKYIIVDLSLNLANMAAGAVCFWQVWSILENESSCNDAKWAKIAQKIMIDKTERHLNIDLSELKKEEAHED